MKRRHLPARHRSIRTVFAITGSLMAAIASAGEVDVAVTDSRPRRDVFEDVTCSEPLVGNTCLTLTCDGCEGQPIDPALGDVLQIVALNDLHLEQIGLENCSVNRVNVALELVHEKVGDLEISLIHDTFQVDLYQPASSCTATGIDAIFSDQGSGPANACPATGGGSFLPDEALSSFSSQLVVGQWLLLVGDFTPGNNGTMGPWRLTFDATCSAKAGPGSCANMLPNVLCLGLEERFEVKATWKDRQGATGSGQAVQLTPDTGYFWFFNQENVEMVVKVLDGCGITSHHWVFASGLTDVEVELSVTDTLTGFEKTYRNPQRTPFAPIQDTRAFASCP